MLGYPLVPELVSFVPLDLLGGKQHYSSVKSFELLLSLHDGVCGRASSQGYHVRLEFCVGYCQEPVIHSMLVPLPLSQSKRRSRQERPRRRREGPAALLEPTAPGRAGYYCGGSTFVTTPHESDGFHVSYAGELCVDIKANTVNLSSRSLLS
jgi:hypothetical protein